jgi:hypothetical protein
MIVVPGGGGDGSGGVGATEPGGSGGGGSITKPPIGLFAPGRASLILSRIFKNITDSPRTIVMATTWRRMGASFTKCGRRLLFVLPPFFITGYLL